MYGKQRECYLQFPSGWEQVLQKPSAEMLLCATSGPSWGTLQITGPSQGGTNSMLFSSWKPGYILATLPSVLATLNKISISMMTNLKQCTMKAGEVLGAVGIFKLEKSLWGFFLFLITAHCINQAWKPQARGFLWPDCHGSTKHTQGQTGEHAFSEHFCGDVLNSTWMNSVL